MLFLRVAVGVLQSTGSPCQLAEYSATNDHLVDRCADRLGEVVVVER